NPAAIRLVNEQIQRAHQRAVDALLDIKICDPAMGSGHFLVEAVDYLTDRVIRVVNQYPQDDPVLAMLERIRKTVFAEMERQGIEINPARLDDTSLLMRVVMKRCIYGVDVNEMAVELAKVSLWLHSFTIGAPLSFLDHHLRCGDSLIGAMARGVQKEFLGELTLFGSPFEGVLTAAKTMQEISLSSDATIADVENSANLYDFFEQAARKYKRVLDIYLMQFFGFKAAGEFLLLFGSEAINVSLDKLGKDHRQLFQDHEKFHGEKKIFHWDLEFPEVFIDLEQTAWREDAGFDAVIGNPPYVDVTADKYYNQSYSAASSRNLYSYMLERSGVVCRAGSMLGMIVPMSLVCSDRMSILRDWFKSNYANIQIANFGIRPAKIFPDVDQRVTILVARKKKESAETTKVFATRLNRWRDGEEQTMIANLSFSDITKLPAQFGWAKLFRQEKRVSDYLGKDWNFYLHTIGRYWLKAYDFEPTYLEASGKSGRSSTLVELSAQSEEIGKVIIALVNSSLFFWYWILYGDEFHLTPEEVKAFPFTYDKGHKSIYKKLAQAADELMKDYKEHSVLKRGKYPTGTITYQEFYPRQSKPIIDRIDDLLGMIYGLEIDEVECVKKYDLQFRTDEEE
ncbi:MAG: Eco57I restriction-modification methylase domain-containing protein, partial [Chloroflexi bacterium]|nr:Eco57I restriction-modification methylase domain-containing protein [Chloroflexota bacterium]